MEPPLKKVKLHTAMQDNVTVPCIMVSETLQHIAQQEDCYFIIHNVPKKQKSPYAQNPWFYNPNQNRKIKAKYLKKHLKKNSCKQLVVKAYQMKAEKLKNSTRLFEVEYIVDFKMINGQRYYLIKWVGWPNEANTWEPDDNLSCSHLIHDFHEDYTMQLCKFLDDRKISWNKLLSCQNKTKGVGVFQRLFNAIPSNFKYVSFYAEQKRKIVTELRMWQRKINDITKSCPLIAIENEVDLCSFPSDFKYTVTNIPGKDVFIPND
uniref:Chromo domain-containing protein n=1 Tax=Ciona savignyi TaxID=51511 RepID=H2YGY0_CIOSA